MGLALIVGFPWGSTYVDSLDSRSNEAVTGCDIVLYTIADSVERASHTIGDLEFSLESSRASRNLQFEPLR
jgi:hypothetical protein